MTLHRYSREQISKNPVHLGTSGPYDMSVTIPYSYIEADALFHNVSPEVIIRRYLTAKLQEVSHDR